MPAGNLWAGSKKLNGADLPRHSLHRITLVMNATITLVLGGVASGKSAYAEGLAEATSPQRLYVATAEPHDDEMVSKIRAHRERRGNGWRTEEATLDVAPVLGNVSEDLVLLDCASMWLTNHLMAETDLEQATEGFLAALTNCRKPVIVVSNEVGLGGVEVNKLARRFANEQGRLNQKLAEIADRIILVTAGIPLVLRDKNYV